MASKKVKIVFEDSGKLNEDGGMDFNMYLEGDIERLAGKIKMEELQAAEYWGSQMFNICQSVLKQTGAIKNCPDLTETSEIVTKEDRHD